METILKYFPDLTERQREQFAAMYDLYVLWNSQINVISRKDIEQLYLHHVLHSLAIARVLRFTAGTEIMDVGCGGGFPGIPLAVMFPECNFTLVDSIGKKIKVVNEVAAGLGMTNVKGIQARAEQIDGKFEFVVSRAVTDLPTFLKWVWPKFSKEGKNSMPNGILYLKGGDISAELVGVARSAMVYNISDFFDEEFFETKKVVYVTKKF